jgi:DNA-binding NarL/FixJ family response regulator
MNLRDAIRQQLLAVGDDVAAACEARLCEAFGLGAHATSGRTRTTATTPAVALDRVIAELAREHGITDAERRVVSASARGVARQDIPRALGVAESTVKTQVRMLVSRCGQETLADITRLVWKRVLAIA